MEQPPLSRPRGTTTSRFGSGRREAHDAREFYARFTPPVLSDDRTVHGPVPDLAPARCFLGDAAAMTQLPANSVALVVTSPPYFVGKEYELAVTTDGHQSSGRIPTTYLEFLAMLRSVFTECVRVLEPGGRIAVNVANLGRKPYRSLSADVIGILQDDLGLLLRGEVIWQKGAGASGSCAWGSFRSAANPVLRDITERVIIASKGRFDRAYSVAERKAKGLPHEPTVSNDEFVDVTRDIWEIDAESATRVGHPAPFPVELPRRLIDLYTYKGDIVLDPFMGSGTTLVAAARTGRVGVGYDLDPTYVALAERRVADELTRVSKLREVDQVVTEQLEFELQVQELSRLSHDERQEHFQARAVREGKKAQDIALRLLEEAGFSGIEESPKLRGGVQFNYRVSAEEDGAEWYVDVSGAFTTSRPGLVRTDTLWKMLGRLHVLRHVQDHAKLLVLTSNLPRPASEGDKALRAIGPSGIFDVIELYDPAGHERLRRYAAGETAPLAGFWTAAELADRVR
jgi:site-specific DNA-methyltransferase (adenine-specific)